LKIYTNDDNINNLMFMDDHFVLIDFGKAKIAKSFEEALEHNLGVLVMIAKTISGEGA
jgi:tRNA A-37 threonylcarbamoyl transferase component Bud32